VQNEPIQPKRRTLKRRRYRQNKKRRLDNASVVDGGTLTHAASYGDDDVGDGVGGSIVTGDTLTLASGNAGKSEGADTINGCIGESDLVDFNVIDIEQVDMSEGDELSVLKAHKKIVSNI
jgi:hypothetical protein